MSLAPCGAHPLSGAMLVLVCLIDEDQALRRDPVLKLYPLASPPCDGGTIAFAGDDSFFEAELLGVNDVPHRSIIDLKAAPGELGHKTVQSKPLVSDPLHPKGVVLAGNRMCFPKETRTTEEA